MTVLAGSSASASGSVCLGMPLSARRSSSSSSSHWYSVGYRDSVGATIERMFTLRVYADTRPQGTLDAGVPRLEVQPDSDAQDQREHCQPQAKWP